ncbi:hypothetical protein ON010_g16836 [Phytophthora cinnamomi]|nr:hypothetical protein ON010_g16836 [Phytophthora cinnamomi]
MSGEKLATRPPADLSNEEEVSAYIKQKIRVFSNFPKPGADFSDVTSLLLDPVAFQAAIEALRLRYAHQQITHVVSCESRGFIFGAPLALALQAAFVPVRRARRLPGDVVGVDYVSGFYTGRMEIHQDAITEGGRVVIIDDLVASVRLDRVKPVSFVFSLVEDSICCFLCCLLAGQHSQGDGRARRKARRQGGGVRLRDQLAALDGECSSCSTSAARSAPN